MGVAAKVRASFVPSLCAGAGSGAIVGIIDGVSSWGQLARFHASAAGIVRFIGFLAAAYSLTWAPCGALAFALASPLWRRAPDPSRSVANLARVLAGMPLTIGLLAVTHAVMANALGARNNMGIVVTLTMVATLIALGFAALATRLASRPLENLLRRLAHRSPWIGSPRAPWIAAAVFVAAGLLLAALRGRATLEMLSLRGPLMAVLLLVLFPLLRAPLGVMRDGRATAIAITALPVSALMVFEMGREPAIHKSAWSVPGLLRPILSLYRVPGDWDRDGFSTWLNGGDCNDHDRSVHPGAFDVPGDGIDQNCVAGDSIAKGPADGDIVAPGAKPDTNIVLISIDALRADHLGAYGYARPTSPSLDALAREGAIFLNAWSHAPMTRYAIPSLVTGRYPLAIPYEPSAPHAWRELKPEATTMAEVLKARGYFTAAILNYSYFNAERGLDQGFDHYDNRNKRLHGGDGAFEPSGSSSREQTDKAIELVQHVPHDAHFFLWVHYFDPHHGYERHAETTSFGEGPVDRYDGEIRFTDEQIGRLLGELRTLGHYDHTIIVVTGDHGEAFGEHGNAFHGTELYAAQTKVPLIMRVPGLAPRRVRRPTGHIDVLPTLAELTGAGSIPGLQGESVLSAIAGDSHSDDHVVFQQLSAADGEKRAAVNEHCHVIYDVKPENSWEVYRLDTDPHELHDAFDHPGDCAALIGLLGSWLDGPGTEFRRP